MNHRTLDQRADELDKQLEDNPIDKSIEAIIKADRERHTQVKILGVTVIIQTLLIIGFAVLAFQAHNIAVKADKNQTAVIESCRAGNEFRATEASLWTHILEMQSSNTTNRTPEQQAKRDQTVEEFKDYLTTVFAPRDCDKLTSKNN